MSEGWGDRVPLLSPTRIILDVASSCVPLPSNFLSIKTSPLEERLMRLQKIPLAPPHSPALSRRSNQLPGVGDGVGAWEGVEGRP